MAEDAFARPERRVPPRARPAPALDEDESVVVVCSCGVTMSFAWRRAEPVRCFGCGREFAPPPTATSLPLRWRPDLAAAPVAEPQPSFAGPVAVGVVCAALLFLLLGLAVSVLLSHP